MVPLGRHREQSDITKAEAQQRAESLRAVFDELSGLSARKAAEVRFGRCLKRARVGRGVAAEPHCGGISALPVYSRNAFECWCGKRGISWTITGANWPGLTA